MGFLSDSEIRYEDGASDPDTPPGSPRLAATHAQAIAENFTNSPDLNTRTLREYAALCCEELGLTDMDKNDVLKTSQMHPHLIAVRQYTRTVALAHNVSRLLTESFLESTEFKDHVTRRVQATFLDAELPTYVRGCTSRLIQHMQENPASWRIPPIVHNHFLQSKAFRKAVAAVASNFRGDIKRKIVKSMADKQDIGAFAKKLCVKGYQPTVGHWRRFALLRSYMVDWEKLPVKPGKGRGISFWMFIDTKLDKLRAQCAKDTEAETQRAIKDKLKANVKEDQKQYAGPASGATKLPARILLPEWQKDHAKAVQDMAGYAIEAGTEDDIDDDEGNVEHTGPRVSVSDNVSAEDRGNDGDIEDDLQPESSRSNSQAGSVGLAHTQDIRTGRTLVPETQETLGRTQAECDVFSNHGGPSSSLLRTCFGADTQSSLASYVPETQLRPTPPQANGMDIQDSNTPPESPSQQVPQAGRAAGTLVDRRPRTLRSAPSPLTRASPTPSSRPRRN